MTRPRSNREKYGAPGSGPFLTLEHTVRSPVRGKIFPNGTKLFYGRRSSRAESRLQVGSVAQQRKEVFEKFGEIPEFIEGTRIPARYEDDCSGRSFSRPRFEEMIAFCEANPQPRENGCFIAIYNISRFGRVINKENMTAEVREMKLQYLLLWKYGWNVRFLHDVPDTEEVVQDFLFDIAAKRAADYSISLTHDTSRGKHDYASKGLWTSGTSPFGTRRFCLSRNTELRDTTWEKEEMLQDDGSVKLVTKPGDYGQKNSTILVPHTDELLIWEQAARMFLKGASYEAIAKWLRRIGARTRRWTGECWNARTVARMLTNKALIGIVVYRGRKVEEPTEFKAQWEAMVDEKLFHAVCAERAKRDREGTKGVAFDAHRWLPLSGLIFCAKCGLPFYPNHQRGEKGKADRLRYKHHTPVLDYIAGEEAKALVARFGCQGHALPSDAVHKAIRDQLRALRSGPQWGAVMRRLFDDAIKERIEKLKRMVRNNNESIEMEEDDDQREEFRRLARLRSQELKAAREELKRAEQETDYGSAAWEVAEEILNETEDVLATWDSQSVEAQARIASYWILRIDAECSIGPGGRSHKPFKLHIWMRNMPDLPITVDGPVLSRSEKALCAIQRRALDLDVPFTEVCVVCLDAPCTCGANKKWNALGENQPSMSIDNPFYPKRITVSITVEQLRTASRERLRREYRP